MGNGEALPVPTVHGVAAQALVEGLLQVQKASTATGKKIIIREFSILTYTQ
jgi:hypothetical protein